MTPSDKVIFKAGQIAGLSCAVEDHLNLIQNTASSDIDSSRWPRVSNDLYCAAAAIRKKLKEIQAISMEIRDAE